MLPKEILKKIKRLEIKTSRLVEGQLAGSYLSTFRGRGIEFSEVREYLEGDDVRSIDWNVTARMNAPFVKTFMEERDLTVMIAVDFSGSMEFGTLAQTKRELAIDFCAAAALLAAGNNDRVGLIAYAEGIELFIPPRKGRRHVLKLLAELSALKPVGRGSGHAAAASMLMRVLKTRATLFWVSDYMGMDGAKGLKALSRRHELVPVLLADGRESVMPPVGLVELSDPETGTKTLVDTSSREFIDAFTAWKNETGSSRETLFKSLRAEHIEIQTGGSPVTPLTRYFRRKARLGRH